MNEDLRNEIEAINSIYGDDSLSLSDEPNIFVLRLPQQNTSLRLRFPGDYPAAPPAVLGTESSGQHTRKGEAGQVADVFRNILGNVHQPGDVCLFDVIEEVNSTLTSATNPAVEDEGRDGVPSISKPEQLGEVTNPKPQSFLPEEEPLWILSDVIIELKSVFIARCAAVSSPEQAKRYLQHLLDNDKKIRTATHNITAWRIRGEHGTTFQDCDDDGETAAGGRVLHLMQLMGIWDAMVVVTRWFGGHQLGPKRFSIINTVARDALVKGEFVQGDPPKIKKKGR